VSYVDDAFEKMRQGLEITSGEQGEASRRQEAIRDHVCSQIELRTSFLTGSYRRHTKTKPLADVDIFCVVKGDGANADLRDLSPSAVLERLRQVLAEEYDDPPPEVSRRSCTVDFTRQGGNVISYDVVLAFDRDKRGFEIPDRTVGDWIGTDPTVHAEKATSKNEECGGKWVPFVKMVKGWNREWDKPVRPSFLLEVMALELVRRPFGRYQDEVALFFANAAEQIEDVWPDPAGLGPDVNSSMSESDKRAARERLREAQRIAEDALQLEDDGSERQAVEEWRRLFGGRMPRP
jgi:Second Messenger Oligonucleotide or Dinucleotide Synthetase domain